MTSFNNPSVISGLPAGTAGDRIWAYLILEQRRTDATPAPEFTFLANPETLAWSRKTVYSEAITAATSVQAQQYYHTTGRTWEVPDLLLETWHAKRAVKPLLEKLQALMVPTAQTLTPKVLSFVWGAERLGPCVLTDLRVREFAWLNGVAASARVDLTLLEVPPPDADPTARIRREQSQVTGGDRLPTPLTDRQRADGSSKALEWLRANLSKLPAPIQERVRSNRYRLSTDAATGRVAITTESGQSLGVVGRWNGRQFQIDDQSFETSQTASTSR